MSKTISNQASKKVRQAASRGKAALIWAGVRALEGFLRLPVIGKKASDVCYHRHVARKARQINKLLSGRKSCATFLFLSDVHWGANSRKSPGIIRFIRERTPVKKVVFGGDFITHSDTSKRAMAALGKHFMGKMGFADRSLYCILGNHDDNSYEQANAQAILTDREIESILYHQHHAYPVEGFDAFNYYFDCQEERTRYLCLNTAKRARCAKQLRFICDTLLSAPGGWNVVAIAHIWVEMGGTGYQPNAQTEEIIGLFDAYNARQQCGEADFKGAGAHVVCLVGGHVHNDYQTTSGGGIPILLFDCDAAGKTYSRYPPVRGLASEQCVTCIVLDAARKKGYAVRIGRGRDMEFGL